MGREKVREVKTISNKGKMTFVMFQLEGSDETMQEGFRAMEHAFDKLASSQKIVSIGAPKAQVDVSKAGSANDDGFETERSLEDDSDSESEETGSEISEARVRRPRKVQKINVLDIDMNAQSIPLKEFVGQHRPLETDFEKYQVIGAWFKDVLRMPLTMEGAYTAYKYMDWNSPADVASPLRDLANKKKHFNKVEGKGAYEINHLGLNEVRGMRAVPQ